MQLCSIYRYIWMSPLWWRRDQVKWLSICLRQGQVLSTKNVMFCRVFVVKEAQRPIVRFLPDNIFGFRTNPKIMSGPNPTLCRCASFPTLKPDMFRTECKSSTPFSWSIISRRVQLSAETNLPVCALFVIELPWLTASFGPRDFFGNGSLSRFFWHLCPSNFKMPSEYSHGLFD